MNENEQIRESLYFLKYKYPYKQKQFKKILDYIRLNKEKYNLKELKSKLKNMDFEKNLVYDFKNILSFQGAVILDEDFEFNLNEVGPRGLTFKEEIEEKKKDSYLLLLGFLFRKENSKKDVDLVFNTYKNKTDLFWETQSKRARELVLNKRDLKYKDGIKGWRSVAILDSRTSALCASLHGAFYSVRSFQSRLELPFQIPRHPRCRSEFVTIYSFEKETRVDSLKEFLNNNPKDAEKILGKKKYKIFKENPDAKIVDFKKNKFFTNKDILKNLKKGGGINE